MAMARMLPDKSGLVHRDLKLEFSAQLVTRGRRWQVGLFHYRKGGRCRPGGASSSGNRKPALGGRNPGLADAEGCRPCVLGSACTLVLHHLALPSRLSAEEGVRGAVHGERGAFVSCPSLPSCISRCPCMWVRLSRKGCLSPVLAASCSEMPYS